MSQSYSSSEGILEMLGRGDYTEEDLEEARADLDAMKENIRESTYENIKILLDDKLKRMDK